MLNQQIHRNYMYDIIVDIFNSPLKKYIAFKGGTLCYFIYGLDRFSTDLDFDIIKNHNDISIILKNILSKYGSIKDEYNKQNTIFFLLNYGEHEKNIKVELNKKKQILDTYEIINFFGTPINAMTQDCIFSNKLVALSQRYKNRDLFDIYFFFKNHFPINEDLIKLRTKMSYKQLLNKLLKEIPKHYKPNTLLAEIGELVSEKQKFFIKNKLIQETINYIQFQISL